MSSYFLSRGGQQLGPFSEPELRTMLATGQASPSDLGCVAGDSEWKPLSALLNITPAQIPSSDAASTIIPYKNPPALIGYYLGVFSLIPCIGFLIGIPALILGIVGLKKSKEAPGSKGKAHAWTAIILGSIAIVLWGVLGALFVIGSMADRR